MKQVCVLEPTSSTRISRVTRIVDLLGDDVVLIPVITDTKKPAVEKWQSLDITCMSDPEHLRALERGNIGVSLGAASNGLCTVDIDRDDAVEPFLADNPRLRETLITARKRGCNFWVKIEGEYPRSHRLPFGEWRADGNQTVICGSADGVPYRFVNEVQPITVTFDELVLPESTKTSARRANDFFNSATSATSATSSTSSTLQLCQVRTVEEAIALAMPETAHQNNHALFTFARAVKTLEAQGVVEGAAARIVVFDDWHRQAAARGVLRPGQSRDGYLLEFLHAYRCARHLLIDEAVSTAWQAAQTEPFPPEAAVFESDEAKRLVGLCYQMHRLADGGEWFIPTRTAAKLLAVSHQTVCTWFSGLVALDILKITQKHTTTKATRFKYQSSNSKMI